MVNIQHTVFMLQGVTLGWELHVSDFVTTVYMWTQIHHVILVILINCSVFWLHDLVIFK